MTTKQNKEELAQDVASEVDGDSPDVIFIGEGEDRVTIRFPRKWKRFKFMKVLRTGDLLGALEVVFPPDGEVPHPVIEALEEVNIDEKAFEKALEDLAKAVGGLSLGN